MQFGILGLWNTKDISVFPIKRVEWNFPWVPNKKKKKQTQEFTLLFMLWRCNINFIFLKIKFIVYLFYWSMILGSVLARSMFRGSVIRVRASEGILGSCVSSMNTFFLTWNKTYDLFFFRDHPVFQVCSVEQPSNSVSRIHEYINFLPLLCHWLVFD